MRKILLLIGVGLAVLALLSCQEESLYSCDPQIEDWAKKNLSGIQRMSRADFIKIDDLQYQRAAFRAFSSEQRQGLWLSKLDEVLSLDWNVGEKQHLLFLRTLLDKYKGLFHEEFPEQLRDKLYIEVYRWAEYAKDSLGWDNHVIYAIAGNPNRMLTKIGTMEIKSNGRTSKANARSESERDCECSTSFQVDQSAIIKDCDETLGGCHSAKCKDSSWGCGLFWGEACRGMCY